jgi:hypothetical protein
MVLNFIVIHDSKHYNTCRKTSHFALNRPLSSQNKSGRCHTENASKIVNIPQQSANTLIKLEILEDWHVVGALLHKLARPEKTLAQPLQYLRQTPRCFLTLTQGDSK